MNYKRFFFAGKGWLATELLALLLLACSGAWAGDVRGDVRGDIRSDGPATALEQAASAVDALANEAARDSGASASSTYSTTSASLMSATPRQTPLDAMQDAVKSVLNSALETVQSNSLVEAGMASWYGSAFQGRRTASGERFDMNQLTAAHKTLPLGTVVQVRNPLNGKTVDVTINDRGPFIKGRIIDLSYRAALALGIVQSGRQPVEVHRR
jgi:rare lipoprotein A